jgi:hypothetical protein
MAYSKPIYLEEPISIAQRLASMADRFVDISNHSLFRRHDTAAMRFARLEYEARQIAKELGALSEAEIQKRKGKS